VEAVELPAALQEYNPEHPAVFREMPEAREIPTELLMMPAVVVVVLEVPVLTLTIWSKAKVELARAVLVYFRAFYRSQ
jgi:hypothetical protein